MSEATTSRQPGSAETRIDTVAVVAAGTIGVSWTALFLAHGLAVRVYDPRPGIEKFVRTELAQIEPTLAALGLPSDDLTHRLEVADSLEGAVGGADAVQESGPEDLAVKHRLLADIERAAGPETLILSSTSALTATQLATPLSHPGRLLVAHPFNPPHVIPLVEVVPGEATEPDAVSRAVAFYEALGKHPVVLGKEVPGFVANRLQAALFRECIHLVTSGVVDVAGLDRIVTSSIGLRWAAQGPFLSFDLGGGSGGLPAFFEHLGAGLASLWGDLGDPKLDDATVALVSEQAERAYGGRPEAEFESERDHAQLAILRALRT